LITALLLSWAPAHAFNALGHKVIAEIAWEELLLRSVRRSSRSSAATLASTETLPQQLPSDIEEDNWIFWQAAVWPDLARNFKGEDRNLYDHPKWHYVNFPLFVGPERPLFDVNVSMDYPTPIEQTK
jgi:hypothetical protein